MVGILLTNHQCVHVVFVLVAGCLINAVCGNGKINVEAFLVQPFVIESVGCGGFHNAVFAQRQLFGQGQDALGVGVKGGNILGQMPVYRVGHTHQFGRAVFHTVIAVVVQIVDLERRSRQQHGLAGLKASVHDAAAQLPGGFVRCAGLAGTHAQSVSCAMLSSQSSCMTSPAVSSSMRTVSA